MATSVERVGVEAVEAFEGDWVGERVRDHPWRVNLVNVHRYFLIITFKPSRPSRVVSRPLIHIT